MNKRHTSYLSIVLRASVVAIAFVYMMLSIGVLKATHFCMGREASVVYFSADAKKCACATYSEEKNSCCDEKHEVLRIDDEQKILAQTNVPSPVWMLERVLENNVLVLETLTTAIPTDIDHPVPPPVPLWKSNCSFVFYGDEDQRA